jgi:hypothetical protein
MQDQATPIQVEPSKPPSPWPRRLLKIVGGFAAVCALLVFTDFYYSGQLVGVLLQLSLVLVLSGFILRVWGLIRKSLAFGLIRRPISRESRVYLLQFLNRGLFWVLLGWTLSIAIPAALFTPEEYSIVRALFWVVIGVLILFELAPLRRVYVAPNVLFAIGWVVLAMEMLRMQGPAPLDAVVIDPPFRGEWNVFNGGRSTLINHHFGVDNQQHAMDLDRSVNGPPTGDLKRLESYPAFGSPLYAPADGRIVAAVNDRPDMPIGQSDEKQILGNHVIIEIAQGRYVLMAHLKKGSVRVKAGDTVRRGQMVGQCGNSGNTSEPHLHMQVQNVADFASPKIKTYPMLFRNVTLIRDGRERRVGAADVRRNDRIRVGPETPTELDQGSIQR